MKKIILLIIIFCSISIISAQNTDNILKISFNDFFDKDTISLGINRNKIINGLVITSRKSIGFADLDVTVTDCNKVKIYNKLIVSGQSTVSNKEIKLKYTLKLKSKVNIFLTLNGEKQKFVIDVKKGKYIGLNKNKDRFELSQSQYPFEYD
ncbi:hypothetical protein [Chryseobacterium sp.]|uniref:hypothetical protein n=1 Tax=Chryseobacterium sp. TaxID=1871047 RepID=UPI002FCB8DA8